MVAVRFLFFSWEAFHGKKSAERFITSDGNCGPAGFNRLHNQTGHKKQTTEFKQAAEFGKNGFSGSIRKRFFDQSEHTGDT